MFTSSISLLYCLCEYAREEVNLRNRAWRRRTLEVVGRCRELLSNFGEGWNGTRKYQEIFDTFALILVQQCEAKEVLSLRSQEADETGSVATPSSSSLPPSAEPLSDPRDMMQSLWGGWDDGMVDYSTLDYTTVFSSMSPPVMFGSIESLSEAEGLSPAGIFSGDDVMMDGQGPSIRWGGWDEGM